MNKNYEAGRREEYASMKRWRERGYSVIRASGSHGEYDVVAFRPDRKPEFVQCKRCSTEAECLRLGKQFREDTVPSKLYHQTMEIKIKGTTSIISYIV